MITFGLDISHHQGLALNLAQCRRDGIEFVFLKSSEGASFVDSAFKGNLAEARNAGLLVGAYHYVRSNASAAAQVANVRQVVPLDVPVIPDVEANSGGVPLVREFVDRLRAAGYTVPISYIPRWYWQQIGSPSLAGLPPLWSSRYPDNAIGLLADEWSRVPASYWGGYGGLDVAVLQFTSSARIAGHAPLDANAFRGTRDELATLLGHTTSAIADTTITEDDDMRTFWVHGDSVGEMGSSAPKGYEKTKWGDAMFHVDATADGLRRRHISADEWAAVQASGAKSVTRAQAWVDTLPWGDQPGLFPWLKPTTAAASQ
jgi:GH25 family lysozyme M1 (1,4-beta-N-acetylmuramidase)